VRLSARRQGYLEQTFEEVKQTYGETENNCYTYDYASIVEDEITNSLYHFI